VGVNSLGSIDTEIPGSWYSGPDTFPEITLLSEPKIDYQYEVIGTGNGKAQLWFYHPINVIDNNRTNVEVMSRIGLKNITISKDEKQSYNYDYDKIVNEVNELTSKGWDVEEALDLVISTIDTDGDGTPDIIDNNPIAKIPTTISCNIQTTSIKTGDSVNIYGSLNYKTLGISITLKYTKPDGSTYTKTVTSKSDGSYSDSITPDIIGSWTVQASWEGDRSHQGSSTSKTFIVKSSSTSIIPGIPDLLLLSLPIILLILIIIIRRKPKTEQKKKPPSSDRLDDYFDKMGKKLIL
jgi:hypothetical protein